MCVQILIMMIVLVEEEVADVCLHAHLVVQEGPDEDIGVEIPVGAEVAAVFVWLAASARDEVKCVCWPMRYAKRDESMEESLMLPLVHGNHANGVEIQKNPVPCIKSTVSDKFCKRMSKSRKSIPIAIRRLDV